MALDFGGGGAAGGQDAGGGAGQGQGDAGGGAAPAAWQQGRPEGVPEQYWRQSQADPTKGEVDVAAAIKAATDSRTAVGNRDRIIASLRADLAKAGAGDGEADAGDGTIPVLDDYTRGFDWQGLHAAAPKAYPADSDGDRQAIGALLAAARDVGIPVDKARALAEGYYRGLDELTPDAPTEEQVRARIAGELGVNGRQIMSDVDSMVAEAHRRQPFTKPEQAALTQMAMGSGGQAVLWRLLRASGSGAPPTATARDAMSSTEIDEALGSERYRTDAQFRDRVHSAMQARQRRTGAEAQPGVSRAYPIRF